MIVRILGAVDGLSALTFLMLIFGASPFPALVIFCGGLLLCKGLFVFMGDVLSILDIFSALVLFLSLLFTLPAVVLWIPAFLLLAKAVVSFA